MVNVSRVPSGPTSTQSVVRWKQASQKDRAGTSTRRHSGQVAPMTRVFRSSAKKRLAASPAK